MKRQKKHRMKVLGEGRILLIHSIRKDTSCVMIKGSDSISLDFFLHISVLIVLSYSTWEHEEKKRIGKSLINDLTRLSLNKQIL
jgi:hypothetical protein